MTWVSDLEKRLRLLEQEDKDDARELELLGDQVGKLQQDAFIKLGGNYGGVAGTCTGDFTVTVRNSLNSNLIPGATVTATQGATVLSGTTGTSGGGLGVCVLSFSTTGSDAGTWVIAVSLSRFTTNTTTLTSVPCSSNAVSLNLTAASGYHSTTGASCWQAYPDSMTVTDPFGTVTISWSSGNLWRGCAVTPANVTNSSDGTQVIGVSCAAGHEGPVARTYQWDGHSAAMRVEFWVLSGAPFGFCAGVPEANTTCADTAHSGHTLSIVNGTLTSGSICPTPVNQTWSIVATLFGATVSTTTGTGSVTLTE